MNWTPSLDESDFYTKFPGVTLKDVEYINRRDNYFYRCIFEVPDNYWNLKMNIMYFHGIPLLNVTTGALWFKKSTRILDWRLMGMLNDKLREIKDVDKNISEVVQKKFIKDLLKIISAVANNRNMKILNQGFNVFNFYYTILYPEAAVPGFSTVESYFEYINSLTGEAPGTSWEVLYDNYKRNNGF